MKLITLNANPTMKDALEAVDKLRAAIVSGEVGAFVAVGITPADGVLGYCGSSRPVSRLRMQGAIAQLNHDWIAGKF